MPKMTRGGRAAAKQYTHVSAREMHLIKNMKREGLTWAMIRRITGRGKGALARCFKAKLPPAGVKEANAPKVGRPVKITPSIYKKLDTARTALLRAAGGVKEVTMEMVKKRAGVVACDKVVREEFSKRGIKFRKLKARLLLSRVDRSCRLSWARKRTRRSKLGWARTPHAIIDNKNFKVSSTKSCREYTARRSIRGAYQGKLKKGEAIKPYLIKPKEQNKFPMRSIQVTAAVIKGRIRMWHYVDGRWNGAKAAAMYEGPLAKALKKAYTGHESGKWNVIEDNDPAGYKSRKGIAAKKRANIIADDLPKRSPDFNVLDYSLWHAINTRMRIQERGFHKNRKETKVEFFSRLRRTALTLPSSVVKRAVCDMHRRVRLCVKAKGGLFSESGR